MPILVETNKKDPVLLIVPAVTSSPILFLTGIGSPVNIDSSTLDEPSITLPSTGIFSPGRTLIVSDNPTCSIAKLTSLPLRITNAVFGCSPISLLIA